MPRLRLPVLVLFASLAPWPAQSTTPPPTEDEIAREENREAVAEALKPCSAEATKRGVYEIIEVAFAYDGDQPFTPTFRSTRPGLQRQAYWCIERALSNLRIPPLRDERYPEARFYAVGAIPPFPGDLLPAWQRAMPDPARVRRALRAWLPPEVEVTSAGCLHLAGPALLAKPFHEWPHVARGGRPFFLLNGDRLYALPDDWWVRHSHLPLEHDQMADEQFCLDHVDPALSVLRRSDTWLHDAVNGAAIFDAEWVVDGQGRLTGDVGFCLVPPPERRHMGNDLRPDEAEAIRRQVEGLLGRLDYGHAAGLRGVRIRYDAADGLVLGLVQAAARPLDRPASAIEAGCDVRKVLHCSRVGEPARATLASLAPLRTCLRESGANEHLMSASFDISPDGQVTNSRIEPSYVSGALAIPACVQRAVAQLSFPRSDGGSCFVLRPLNEILWQVNEP